MAGLAATVGSMHTCPMCNPGLPPPPHVGGPIIGPGAPNVLFNNKPAALMGDICTCSGPPDTIMQGEANVLVNGVPVVTVGCMTSHGGAVTQGEPTILISTSTPSAIVTAPIDEMSFPDISYTLKALSSLSGRREQLNEAIENQEILRNEAAINGYLNSFSLSL